MIPVATPIEYQTPVPRRSSVVARLLSIRVSRECLLVSLVQLGAGVLLAGYAGGRQRANMARARAHIPAVRAAVAEDPRFSGLRFNEYTAHNGSLQVSGAVAGMDDLADLKKIVAATSPPVQVVWTVFVRTAAGPTTATTTLPVAAP